VRGSRATGRLCEREACHQASERSRNETAYRHSLLVSQLVTFDHLLFAATVFTGIGAFAYGYGHLAHTIADLLLRR
jgi:hypothetical protein